MAGAGGTGRVDGREVFHHAGPHDSRRQETGKPRTEVAHGSFQRFCHPLPRVRTHYFHTLQKRVGMETEVTMSTLFYLSSAQMDTIRPFFPRSRGVPRVDDQKILSGIIYVLKFGLQWKDAPKEYGPYKTLYNRFVRWSKMGVFEKIFTALAENSQDTSLLMIDATHLKAHRTAASLRKKGLLPDVSDEQRED